jgi:hypothetical protein
LIRNKDSLLHRHHVKVVKEEEVHAKAQNKGSSASDYLSLDLEDTEEQEHQAKLHMIRLGCMFLSRL